MGSVGAKQGGGIPVQPPEEPKQQGLNHDMKSAEVSQYAKDNLGIDIPEKVVGKIGRHKIINSLQLVEGLLNELPDSVRKDLDVKVGTATAHGNWYASMQASSGTMTLYTNHYNENLKKSYEWDVKQGWHPENTTADSIFTHELGHRLDYLFTEKKFGASSLYAKWDYADQTTAKQLVQDAIKEVKNKYSYLNKSNMGFHMSTISGYAASKKNGKYQYHETIAEAVADYSQNKENAKPLSKEIWKRLKKGLS